MKIVMKELGLSVVVLLNVATIICYDFASNVERGESRRLSLFIKNGNSSLARTLSALHPKNFLGQKSHTGFITVKEIYGSELFFWFFPAKTDLEATPWIIWLQGGPGYSSLYGLFEIIGPLKIENGELKQRNVTWASDYSVLFIDNPVGAGFSFTSHDDGYPTNEDDVGEQLMEFLQQFLVMFPELRRAPLFLSGESYAGKYVPAFGMQIHRQNNVEEAINLRGLIIGSGMIDPRSMMQYSDLCSSLGVLDRLQARALKELETETVELVDEGRMIDAANKFNETIEYIKKHSRISVYSLDRDPSNESPELEKFLNRPDIRKTIGVGNVTFNFNNQMVYNKMLADIMNTTKPLVEELLEHYGVMCWHGQFDIIMAYSLAVNTYQELKWSRNAEYLNASRQYITMNGKMIGYKKEGGNFVEVLVRNAGHMLPADQPEVAMTLLRDFIDKNI